MYLATEKAYRNLFNEIVVKIRAGRIDVAHLYKAGAGWTSSTLIDAIYFLVRLALLRSGAAVFLGGEQPVGSAARGPGRAAAGPAASPPPPH